MLLRDLTDFPDGLQRIDVPTTTIVRVFQTDQTGRGVVHTVPTTDGAGHLRGGNDATLAINQVHLHA